MTKKDKLLAKIRQNPGAVRFADMERILLDLGFEMRKSKHAVFTRGRFRLVIAEPHPDPHVLVVYVKAFLALLDQLEDE